MDKRTLKFVLIIAMLSFVVYLLLSLNLGALIIICGLAIFIIGLEYKLQHDKEFYSMLVLDNQPIKPKRKQPINWENYDSEEN